MKRKVVWIVILLISHAAIFALGSAIGRHQTMSHVSKELNKADAQVNLGLYTIYRDIALAIKESRYDSAKCAAELGASSKYDELKSCLADQSCNVAIEQQAHKFAPEIYEKTPLNFTYLKSNNGIRACK